jgi:hypothetical protein
LTSSGGGDGVRSGALGEGEMLFLSERVGDGLRSGEVGDGETSFASEEEGFSAGGVREQANAKGSTAMAAKRCTL